MRYFLLLFIPFYSTISFSQTCIIAKKTKDAIYVGGDSRVTHQRKLDGVIIKDTSSMCKIFSYGKYNYAISGSGIDASPSYVRDACEKGGTFMEVIINYCNTFQEWIKNDLNRLKAAMSPSEFDSFYNQNWLGDYNNVIFWGIENDTLFLGMAFFILERNFFDDNIQISGKYAQDSVFAIGHTDSIKNKIHLKSTWEGSYINAIKRLIKIEINENPLEVGGTLHFIKFTKQKGVQWIGGKKWPCN